MKTIALRIDYIFLPAKDGQPLGLNAAVLLSQAIYWTRHFPEGFSKSRESWYLETGLTETKLETARARLRGAGLLHEWEAGFPLTTHYRADIAAVNRLLGDNQPERA